MATKQTRRSISVRGETYEALRKYCSSTERSMSDVVEEQLSRLLVGRTSAPHTVRKVTQVGRPAPTPAHEVIRARVGSSKSKQDYRAIRF